MTEVQNSSLSAKSGRDSRDNRDTVDLARVFIGTNTGRGLGTSRDNGACPYLSLQAPDPVPTRVLSGMWAQELVFHLFPANCGSPSLPSLLSLLKKGQRGRFGYEQGHAGSA